MTDTTTTLPAESGDEQPSGQMLHMGIAEQGKIYALAGDHPRALFYYRRAMQMAIEAGDPEVFFRHYLECVVESLERMGSFEEVAEYCEKAIGLYEANPPQDGVGLRDLAHIHQRLGVVRLRRDDRDGARASLSEALRILAGSGQRLPLAERLVRWLDMRLHLDAARIQAELDKVDYFSVRESTVQQQRAIQLPDSMMPPGLLT